MYKENILKLLARIKYPGFSRDIVSFGMVKDVNVEKETVHITLSLSSNEQKIKDQLRKEIELVIQKNTQFANVGVFIIQPEDEKQGLQTRTSELQKGEFPNIKYIIAVASGKGGVGKSTVAINLAATLSKQYKVGLLDLDIYGPSLPSVTGINDTPRLTEQKKITPIEKFGMKLMSFGFISGNASPTIWRGPMVARMTQQFFDEVEWGKLDFLILDLPPGTGDIQLTLVQRVALTGAVIVTTPQDLAVKDVQKGADMFRKVNTPVLGIIENMTHFQCPHCEEITQIFPGNGGQEESERLNVPLLGQIHLSPDLAFSTDTGSPYVLKFPDSIITKIYTDISEKLIKLIR